MAKKKKTKDEKVEEAAVAEFAPFKPAPWYRRIVSPGHAVAALGATVVVYFAWGVVFKPGGTGSNVVLGLLLAVALIYLVAVNVGPSLDSALFKRLSDAMKKRDELVRFAENLLETIGKRIKKKRAKNPAKTKDLERAYMVTVEKLTVAQAAADDKTVESACAALEKQITELEAAEDKSIGKQARGFLAQARSLAVFFTIALVLRAGVVEPFQIPSSSMIPTLLIGDHLFVGRYQYGVHIPMTTKYLVRWAVPKPGDVVVFVAPDWVPLNAGQDWIKRVIAGPGQTVKMRGGVMYVDGQPYAHVGDKAVQDYWDYDGTRNQWHKEDAHHERERIGETEHSIYLKENTRKTWPVNVAGTRPNYTGLECTQDECRVLDGHIFVMGDNRDRSSDGRFWGAVPVDHVKGKALFIWMSVAGHERSVDLGRFTLPGFRWERLFKPVE